MDKNKIFLSALTGILANQNFFGATMQGDPQAAIDFAKKVADLVEKDKRS